MLHRLLDAIHDAVALGTPEEGLGLCHKIAAEKVSKQKKKASYLLGT